MDIEFRNVGGSRVGFIIGSDIKDTNGNRVGMIVGSDIKDSSGNRVGMLNGSDIRDTHGNRVGIIIGDDIKDTYGNRVGYAIGSASEIEKAAAGLLLFNLEPAVATSSPTEPSSPRGEGGSGGELSFWALVALFFLAFWHYAKGPFVAFSLIKETAARKEWWGTVVRTILLSILFMFIFAMVGGLAEGGIAVIIFTILWLAFLMLPIIAVSIRRMHDIGVRGWWILVPLANFVMCAFFPGKVEGNRYL